MPMPRKPAINEEEAFVDIIRLIRNEAIAIDHYGKTLCSKNANVIVNPIFSMTFKEFIILLISSVKK